MPIDSLIGAASTIITNKQNQKFQRQQYERQKADDLNFWNMTNQYNSPQQQMQRLKEAGLNPNLAYGSVNTEAARISAPNVAPAKNEAIQTNMGAELSKYQDIRKGIQETDNLRKQNEMMDLQKELMQANIFKTIAETDTKKFGLWKDQSLFTIQKDTLGERLKNLGIQNAYLTNKDRREEDSNTRNWELQAPKVEGIIQSNKLKYEQTKSEKVRRDLYRATIDQVLANTDLLKQKGLTERQNTIIARELAENKVVERGLMEGKKTAQELGNELQRIKIRFRELGVSETVTSDIIGDLFGLFRFTMPKQFTPRSKTTSTSRYNKKGEYQGGSTTQQMER